MKIRYCFLLFFLFLIPAILNAQKKNSVKTTAIICGTSDSADRIELQFYKQNIVSNPKLALTYNDRVVNHKFKIKIHAITEPTYITIIFRYPHGISNALEFYLIEPGDSINISQSFTSFNFPGKNSDKVACQHQMKKVKPKMRATGWYKSLKAYQDLKEYDAEMDSITADKLKILAKYKSGFGKEAYTKLQLDCIHDQPVKLYNYINLLLRCPDSAVQKEAIRYYLEYYRYKKIDTLNAMVKSSSLKFIEHLLGKAIIDGELALTGFKPAVYNFRASANRSGFEKIDTDYIGILKEKLLANFFTRATFQMDSLNDCLVSAVKQVKQPYLHNILIEVQRKSIGVPAYNFILPDSNGKKITLSNFKGKVVVVDFWFTGCEWCIEMADVLKIASAARDSNIVYISVCVDNNKGTWKESLKRGIFTSRNEINLYTDGMGQNHPLINYYKISGYPFILIIDPAGKLFAVNPEIGFGAETRPKNLQKIARSALKEKV